jgi:heme/copper-type cytochrome/quinol oxidase subunit 2
VTALKLQPTTPGRYLVVCNEYCGLGHDYMYFSIIVEEGGEQNEKGSTLEKGDGHGKHTH